MAESRHEKQAKLPPLCRCDQFRKKLSQIASRMTKEDLKELKFLCVDYIPDGPREKIKSAETLFEELEKLQMVSPDDRTWLAIQLRQIRRNDLASEVEKWEYLNQNTREIEDLLKKSRIAHKEEKFEMECNLYGKILHLFSNDEDGKTKRRKVLNKRAACFIAQGNFKNALRDCREVLEKNPQDLKAKFLLAKSYEGLKQYSEAYEELKLLKIANPKDPDALILLKKVETQLKFLKCEEDLHSHTSQATGISGTVDNNNLDGDYPTKVLFVCDKWSGWHLDIYSVNRHLCRHFAKTPCVRVACLVLDASEKDIVLASKEGISLKKCSTRSGIPDGDNRLYTMHDDFPFKPDIVFGHGIVTGADASGLAKKFDCKYFQIFYDMNFTDEKSQLGADADFVAAIGPQLSREWSNKLGRDVIEIIPGIPSDSSSRSSVATPHNRALIVDSAANSNTDDLDVAIKALIDCKQRGLSMEISVQGTPKLKKEELKSKLQSELNTKLYTIHVTSDDASIMLVDGEMRAVSLLLMPTPSHTFGMRGLESISSGVPVIISNSYGITDLLLDHFDPKFWVFLCSTKEEDDHESWSDRIDTFLDNRDQKFALASELKQQWEKKFTWDSTTKKILQHLSRSGEFHKAAKSCTESCSSLCSSNARNFVKLEVELHERRRSHILIVSPVDAQKNAAIRHLAKIPWIAVLDFDKNSPETGYLSICQTLGDELGTKICPIRCPHEKVKEKVTFPNGIPWLLIDETPECLKWLKNVISTLESSHLEPITMLILWNASEEKEKLTRTLGKILNNVEASSLQERVKVAVALIDGEKEHFITGIEEDWSTKIRQLQLTDVCNAINESVCETPSLRDSEKFSLPVADEIGSGNHVVTKILPSESRWINAELEILYQSVSDNPEYGSKDAQHFYRGGTISWYALSKGYAIRRKDWGPIKAKIDELLPRCGTLRRKLFHSRGTGGTTSSRWILFEYHKNYPCVNVKSINHQETASAIKVLADFCKLPVLVLIDCKHVLREEFDLDILYNSLSNQRVSCIVLEVSHRQELNHNPKRKELLTVAETLDLDERDTFIATYGEQKIERLQRLKNLKREPDDLQIPFYYALVTHEEKFSALEPFVRDCLENSKKDQRQALIFLAMCHHYAHIAVPEAALTSIFKDAPRDTALEDLLTKESLQLLLEEGGGWRPRHDLIGRNMLKRLLSDGINKDNWIQNLADEAINFISHMPEKLVNELLKNRPSKSEFSPLIEEIPDDDDIIKVFEKAIETFPDNPHFNVHLGRVYSIKKEATGFEMAVSYTDEGIQNAERVGASREVRGQFFQMKGVVYSRRVSFLIKEGAEVNDIVPYAEQGVEWFRRSVSICPDFIDGYIPEVSMMCKLLEYVHKKKGDLHDYLRSPECSPFIVDGISQTSDTLECVPDSDNYSHFKSRLLCLGLRKNSKQDLRKTLNLLEEIRLNRKTSRGPINRKIADIKMELCRQNKKDLSTVASDVIDYLKEALKYAQSVKERELTMRRWIQIAPFVPIHLSDAESLIFKWCLECKSVRSYLYKYIISFIHVLDGSKHYIERMKNAHHDLENEIKIINRGDVGRVRHPDKPVVWLGLQSAKGMGQLIYLENIFKDKKSGGKNILVQEHTQNLRPLIGTITKIERNNVGTIAVKEDLDVSFRTDLCEKSLSSNTFCNRKVQFYLGFNYFGTDAYNVTLIHQRAERTLSSSS